MLLPDVYGRKAPERSFDFSNFPNLQEVDFEVSWGSGGLLWISEAFSTLGPTTSPRLSAVRLQLACLPIANRPPGALINDLGDDLRRVADEVARIKHEFGEAMDLTVSRDPAFAVVLGALNVRFR